LGLEIWSFFGIWSLVVGVFKAYPSFKTARGLRIAARLAGHQTASNPAAPITTHAAIKVAISKGCTP